MELCYMFNTTSSHTFPNITDTGLHSDIQNQSVLVTRLDLWQEVKNHVITKPFHNVAATSNIMHQDLSSMPIKHLCPANRCENIFFPNIKLFPLINFGHFCQMLTLARCLVNHLLLVAVEKIIYTYSANRKYTNH